jgi:hypothetical protein
LTKGVLITNYNFTFNTTSPEAFRMAINAGIVSGAVIPLYGFEGGPMTGGEVQNSTTEYGANIPNGVSAKSFDYHYRRGGSCLEKELGALDGTLRRIIKLDPGYAWFEALSKTEGRGFPANLQTHSTDATSPTEAYQMRLNVAHLDTYHDEWKRRGAVAVSGEFEGLMAVGLEQTTTAGQMRIVHPCSGSDLGKTYAEEFSDPRAFLDASGQNPTTAAVNPDTGILAIAPTTGSYRIAPASVLATLDTPIIGMDGIEELVSSAALTA